MNRAIAVLVLLACAAPSRAADKRLGEKPSLKLPSSESSGLSFKSGIQPQPQTDSPAPAPIQGETAPKLAGIGVHAGPTTAVPPAPGGSLPPPSRGQGGEGTVRPPAAGPSGSLKVTPELGVFFADGPKEQVVEFKVHGLKEEDTVVCYEVLAHPDPEVMRSIKNRKGHCQAAENFYPMPEEYSENNPEGNKEWKYRRGVWIGTFKYTKEEWGTAGIITKSVFMDKNTGGVGSGTLKVKERPAGSGKHPSVGPGGLRVYEGFADMPKMGGYGLLPFSGPGDGTALRFHSPEKGTAERWHIAADIRNNTHLCGYALFVSKTPGGRAVSKECDKKLSPDQGMKWRNGPAPAGDLRYIGECVLERDRDYYINAVLTGWSPNPAANGRLACDGLLGPPSYFFIRGDQ